MTGRPRVNPKDPFYADLGRAIRLARVTAGKSQADAAEHVDVSFQQFQKYETGANRLPVDKLVTLASFLDVPRGAAMSGTGRRAANSEYVGVTSTDAQLRTSDVFQDGWAALFSSKDLQKELAGLSGKNPSVDQVVGALKNAGFRDMTHDEKSRDKESSRAKTAADLAKQLKTVMQSRSPALSKDNDRER